MKKTFTLSFLFVLLAFLARSQTVSITFVVDMTPWLSIGGTINQVHVAGQFATDSSTDITADWNPAAAGSKFANTTGNVYANTVNFRTGVAGDSLQFKFLCDSAWNGTITGSTINNGQNSEGQTGWTHFINGEGCSTNGGNRVLAIPSVNSVFSAAWDSCGNLSAVSGIAPLHGNVSDIKVYPSPAQSNVSISYTTTTGDNITVALRNYTGQVIKVLFNGTQSAGIHNYNVNVSNLANGMYFVTAQSGLAMVQKSFEVSK